MHRTPGTVDPDVVALARRAAALDAQGALTEAIAAWSLVVERAPGFMAACLGYAQANLRAGRPADALPHLDRIVAHTPENPAAWLALGVARSMLGRDDEAVAASARAVALAPQAASVHVGHGDILRQAGKFDAARHAYAEGVSLAPDDPDALNKLAGSERLARMYDDAEAHLLRALALAPDHPLARVNLGTLMFERLQITEARHMLEDALALRGLTADARDEATSALALLDEHAALAVPIEDAMAAGDASPIDAALRARAVPAHRDERLVATFADIVSRARREGSIDQLFPPARSCCVDWPAIEAHHNYRELGDANALALTIDLIAKVPHGAESVHEVASYAQAVASRGADRLATPDGVAWEAWLRFMHRRLTGTRPAYWPGQLKPVNNIVPSNPRTPRTAPRDVAGTLRAVMSDADARLPPGAWRATVHFLALIEIHPFFDGNGRLARYLLNSELIATGRFPTLRPHNHDGELPAILNAARDLHDVRRLAEWFAHASHYASDLDAGWRARTGR